MGGLQKKGDHVSVVTSITKVVEPKDSVSHILSKGQLVTTFVIYLETIKFADSLPPTNNDFVWDERRLIPCKKRNDQSTFA